MVLGSGFGEGRWECDGSDVVIEGGVFRCLDVWEVVLFVCALRPSDDLDGWNSNECLWVCC